MRLLNAPDLEWSATKATKPGLCSLSGLPIAAGDEVYENERGSSFVLVAEYRRYISSRVNPADGKITRQ